MVGRSIALGSRCRTCLNRKCIRYSIPSSIPQNLDSKVCISSLLLSDKGGDRYTLFSLCRRLINERRLINRYEIWLLCLSICIPFFRYSFLWSQIDRWSVLSPPFVIRRGLTLRKTIPVFRSLLSRIHKLCKGYLNTFEKVSSKKSKNNSQRPYEVVMS